MATRYEKYTTGDDANQSIYGEDWNAQTFTPSTTHQISSVRLYLNKVGSPSGNITVSIRATSSGKPTGSDLTFGTVLASSVGTSSGWIEITFDTSYLLVAGTKYAIVVRVLNGTGSHYINWRIDLDVTGYPSSDSLYSSDSGATWSFHSEGDNDLLFEEWGLGGGEGAGVIAIVETRLHYIDAYGTQRYLEGQVV